MGQGRPEQDPESLQREDAFIPFPSAFWEADPTAVKLMLSGLHSHGGAEALGAGLAPRVCPDFHPSAELELGSSYGEVWRWREDIQLPHVLHRTEPFPQPPQRR